MKHIEHQLLCYVVGLKKTVDTEVEQYQDSGRINYGEMIIN